MNLSTKARILHYVWQNGGTHRKQVASHFGIHPNIVSDAVKYLIKEKWVVERKSANSSVGRTPIELRVNPENHAAIAVNYTHDSMSCGVINADGKVLQSKTIQHDFHNPDEIIDLAAKEISELKNKYRGSIIGLAIADPGMVDGQKGEVVRSSSFPAWQHVALGKMFAERTGLETLVVDVSHGRAVAQYRFLAQRDHHAGTMLYIDYSKGTIGFTFLTPEGIWHGAGFAGEVGHVMIDPRGEICNCGARGCLENQAGSQALEGKAKELLNQDIHSVLRDKVLRTADIFSAVKAGDRFAQTLVHDVLDKLGFCAAITAAMLHPRLLVVGAETEEAISVIAGEIRAALNKRILPEMAATITVLEGRPINSLELSGAGLMMFEKVIQNMGG
jgi:predicted NBD/HSP70 family sugar kinase